MFNSTLNGDVKSDNTSRIIIIVLVLMLIAMPIAGYFFLYEKKYEVLFSDLSEQDAAVIVKELIDKKIDYKLSHDGTKIMVAEGSRHDTRLQLMSTGAPLSAELGFEIFDNTEIGMTEFAQRINYQRALQGELARTISSFSEVKHARVHLVIPQSSLFKKASQKPKASVSLIVNKGALLSNKQISGIQRLVAAAVPELGAEDVTIVDQNSEVLSKNILNEEAEMSRSHLGLKKEIEDYLTRKVVSVLDHAFGADKAIVSIDASLHMERINSKVEQVIPVNDKTKEGIVVKKHEQVNHESRGTMEAVLPYDDSASISPPANKNIEVEYEFGRKIEQIISTPGGIKRISVGVLVPAYTSAELIAKIHDIVAMSVGINTARGDAIVVRSIDAFMNEDKKNKTAWANDDYATDFGMRMTSSVNENASVNSEAIEKNKNVVEKVTVNEASERNYLVFILVAFFIVSILFYLNSRRVKNNEQTTLTEKDRELILSQVKDWIRE